MLVSGLNRFAFVVFLIGAGALAAPSPIAVLVDGIGYQQVFRYGETRPNKAELLRQGIAQVAEADARKKCERLLGNKVSLKPAFTPSWWDVGRYDRPDAENVFDFRYEMSFTCELTDYAPEALTEEMAAIVRDPNRLGKISFDGAGLYRPVDKAVEVLGQIGAPAVPWLLDLLSKSSPRKMEDVIRALERTQDHGTQSHEVIDTLFRLSQNRDIGVQYAANGALGAVASAGQADADYLLAQAVPWLESGSQSRRDTALEVLDGLGRKAVNAKPALFRAITDHPEDYAGLTPMAVLRDIGLEAKDVDTVLGLIQNANLHAFIRQAMIESLNDLGRQKMGEEKAQQVEAFLLSLVPGDPAKLDKLAASALRTLAAMGPTADTALNHRIAARMQEVRQAPGLDRHSFYDFHEEAGKAYDQFTEPQRRAEESQRQRTQDLATERTVERIQRHEIDPIALLQDKDARVRAEAVKALKTFDSNKKIPLLLQALRDKDASVRWNAEDQLGELPADRLLESMLPVLHDPSPSARAAAIQLLGKLGPKAEAAVPNLYELIAVDVLKIDSDHVLERTGPMGDIQEAIVALQEIGPSRDPILNGKILRRLDVIADTIDEFNIPQWMVDAAKQTAAAWRNPSQRREGKK